MPGSSFPIAGRTFARITVNPEATRADSTILQSPERIWRVPRNGSPVAEAALERALAG